MPWWGWMIVGSVLLAAELTVNADFWLAVVGAAAFGVGLLGLAGVDAPIWAQWLSFGGLSLLMAIFVRGPLYERLMASTDDMEPDLIGESVTALGAIPAGGTGQVSLRGSNWRAVNTGQEELAEGATAEINQVDGVVLRVRPN